MWTLCLVCTKLQAICLSYTIQPFGDFKNRHIHRSGPRFLERLPPPPVYIPRDLHRHACEGPREADVHNLETIGPQLYRTFTGGRQFLFTRLQLCVLRYRHQKHHNSIDITGAHAPTTEPQPRLSSFFARRILNRTVTKPCSLSSKRGRMPSATSPDENLRTNSG